MNNLSLGPISRTTATAAAGIIVALNLKYKWLPLTMEDTASVAGVLVFLTQIFQRQGSKRDTEKVAVRTEAAAASSAPEASGWGEPAAAGWNDAPAVGWGEPAVPPANLRWTGSDDGVTAMQEILRRLEALERK